jgi:hypothetical protein
MADPVDPATELALEDQSIEVVSLIPRGFARPYMYRVLGAERMTQLEVTRGGDGLPCLRRVEPSIS